MSFKFSDNALEDYFYWQQQNKKTLQKINKLLKEISRTPYEGTGKPEALKHGLSGWWSRRIDNKNRIIYRVSLSSEDTIDIIQMRYHY